MNAKLEKLGSLIPEVFYDLIGRVVPGSFVLAVLAWDARLKLEPVADVSMVVVAPLGLAACYVIGFVLETASDIVVDQVKTAVYGKGWKEEEWGIIRASDDPRITALLVKLKAESAMFRGVFIGWTVLWARGAGPFALMHVGWSVGGAFILLTSYVYREWLTREFIKVSTGLSA